MNRITNLFNTKKNGILSVFFTAGYPKPDDTTKILKELENKGRDRNPLLRSDGRRSRNPGSLHRRVTKRDVAASPVRPVGRDP